MSELKIDTVNQLANMNYVIIKKRFFDNQWWEQKMKFDDISSFLEAVDALVDSPVTFTVSAYNK